MEVKLIRAQSNDRWYSEENLNLLGKTFKVNFCELASKELKRNVYEILTGCHKGKLLDVKDTRIMVNLEL